MEFHGKKTIIDTLYKAKKLKEKNFCANAHSADTGILQ